MRGGGAQPVETIAGPLRQLRDLSCAPGLSGGQGNGEAGLVMPPRDGRPLHVRKTLQGKDC